MVEVTTEHAGRGRRRSTPTWRFKGAIVRRCTSTQSASLAIPEDLPLTTDPEDLSSSCVQWVLLLTLLLLLLLSPQLRGPILRHTGHTEEAQPLHRLFRVLRPLQQLLLLLRERPRGKTWALLQAVWHENLGDRPQTCVRVDRPGRRKSGVELRLSSSQLNPCNQ